MMEIEKYTSEEDKVEAGIHKSTRKFLCIRGWVLFFNPSVKEKKDVRPSGLPVQKLQLV